MRGHSAQAGHEHSSTTSENCSALKFQTQHMALALGEDDTVRRQASTSSQSIPGRSPVCQRRCVTSKCCMKSSELPPRTPLTVTGWRYNSTMTRSQAGSLVDAQVATSNLTEMQRRIRTPRIFSQEALRELEILICRKLRQQYVRLPLSSTPAEMPDRMPTCYEVLNNLVYALTGDMTSYCNKRRHRNSNETKGDGASWQMIASAQPQRMQRLHDEMHDGRSWNPASSTSNQCCVDASDLRSLTCVQEDSQKNIAKTSCESSHTNICPKRSGLGCVRLCYESRDGEDKRECKRKKHRTHRGSKRTREDSGIDDLMSTPRTSKRSRDE